MKHLTLTLLSLLTLFTVYSQDIDPQEYHLLNNSVVHIAAAKNKVGAGFIVGQQDGKIYILTAAHVVSDTGEVFLSFADDTYNGVGTVSKYNEFYDVALIIANDNGMKWETYNYTTNPQKGDAVFFISTRTDRKIVSGKGAAFITYIDNEKLECRVGVQGGDSGSPLFSEYGLTGLNIQDPGISKPVMLLKELTEEWNAPWQLIATRKPEVQVTQKSFDANMEVPIPITHVYGQQAFPELHDGNTTTGLTFSNTDRSTLTILFGEVRSYKKIKFFIPENEERLVPPGACLIDPETKKKIYIHKYMLPSLERYAKGHWVTLSFKKFYTADRVELSFVTTAITDKDGQKRPIGYSIYEIQVLGPKQN